MAKAGHFGVLAALLVGMKLARVDGLPVEEDERRAPW